MESGIPTSEHSQPRFFWLLQLFWPIHFSQYLLSSFGRKMKTQDEAECFFWYHLLLLLLEMYVWGEVGGKMNWTAWWKRGWGYSLPSPSPPLIITQRHDTVPLSTLRSQQGSLSREVSSLSVCKYEQHVGHSLCRVWSLFFFFFPA